MKNIKIETSLKKDARLLQFVFIRELQNPIFVCRLIQKLKNKLKSVALKINGG